MDGEVNKEKEKKKKNNSYEILRRRRLIIEMSQSDGRVFEKKDRQETVNQNNLE